MRKELIKQEKLTNFKFTYLFFASIPFFLYNKTLRDIFTKVILSESSVTALCLVFLMFKYNFFKYIRHLIENYKNIALPSLITDLLSGISTALLHKFILQAPYSVWFFLDIFFTTLLYSISSCIFDDISFNFNLRKQKKTKTFLLFFSFSFAIFGIYLLYDYYSNSTALEILPLLSLSVIKIITSKQNLFRTITEWLISTPLSYIGLYFYSTRKKIYFYFNIIYLLRFLIVLHRWN